MDDKKLTIHYRFFHWGPFLYQSLLTKNELEQIKKLCSKEGEDQRKSLAGLIKHEHALDRNKVFAIIKPYVESYVTAAIEYSGKPLGGKIELVKSWVNYMVAGEFNPIHSHSNDLSFVIFTQIPKDLKDEQKKTISSGTHPGSLNFLIGLRQDKNFVSEHSFHPEEGDIYIFPATLHHYANCFQSKGERISISGNLKITD